MALRQSPDGHSIAFVAVSNGGPKLWICPLDSTRARELPGTENAQYPFWSPDSKSLAFFANGKLQRLDLAGSSPVTLAEAPNPRGGTWGSQEIVVFAPTAVSGLWKVAASGGPATPLTTVDTSRSEFTHRWPILLPDGNRFIYLGRGANGGMRDGKELFYRALEGTLMVAPVRTVSHGLEFGPPTALFRLSEPSGMFAYPYDVDLDGRRILALLRSRVGGDNPSITVLVDWDAKPRP